MSVVSVSPHITQKGNTTRRIMTDVLIALLPCLIVAVVFYGYHVVINVAVCLIFCFGSELLYCLIISKKWSREGVRNASVWDMSFAVTAVILALGLPSVMPVNIWGMNVVSDGVIVFSFDTVVLCALGSVFAIMLAKMLFGGIGRNFANPACTGRIFLFIAFGSAGAFNLVSPLVGGDIAMTGATWLSVRSNVTGALLTDMFLGTTATAAVGETCVIAILVGYVYLCVRRVIRPELPAAIILASTVFTFLFDIVAKGVRGEQMFYQTLAHIMSGGLLFGAVFMATDYSTSPNTALGSTVYAIGMALISSLIRAFGGFPEGFSFALLIMNCAVPLLDKYIVPKPFGYVKPEKQSARGSDKKEEGGV